MNEKVIKAARRHFKKVDPHFFDRIQTIEILDFDEHEKTDVYHSLIRAIMGQQLSVKAAQTIYDRFLDLFDTKYPDPYKLITLDDATLRTEGVSRQKAGYVRNVAQFFLDQDWLTIDFEAIGDDILIEKLTSIKGVGLWTVQMMLMFKLNRPDIFAYDDLGVQNAMKAIYGIDAKGKVLKKIMNEHSSVWTPYRTIGCMYLWRYVDGG